MENLHIHCQCVYVVVVVADAVDDDENFGMENFLFCSFQIVSFICMIKYSKPTRAAA